MISFTGRPKLYPVDQHRDMVYSHAGGKPRLADLYLPRVQNTVVPVILWLHGGGWRFGDRRMAPDLSSALAQRGFAIVSVDYRLTGEAIFPAQVEDVKTAVRWVRSIASTYALDTNHVGLWGSSAGAHLAACAALSGNQLFITEEHAQHSSEVQAVVDGYGPTDFAQMDLQRGDASEGPADVEGVSVPNLLPAIHPESFESRLIGEAVVAGSANVERANPMTYVSRNAPPFFILHGRHDPLVPWKQSEMLFRALCDHGVECALYTMERLGHGFFNRSDLDFVSPGQITIDVSSSNESAGLAKRLRETTFGFDLVETFFRHRFERFSST